MLYNHVTCDTQIALITFLKLQLPPFIVEYQFGTELKLKQKNLLWQEILPHLASVFTCPLANTGFSTISWIKIISFGNLITAILLGMVFYIFAPMPSLV